MLHLKKNLKSFELLDVQQYRDKIDAINRAVLPARILKKKEK